MNRLVRLVVGLYPAWWCRRYGPELQALVEDSGVTWWTVLDLAKGAVMVHFSSLVSRDMLRAAAACGLLGACIGAIVAVVSPVRYASTSAIDIQASADATSPAIVASQAFRDDNLDALIEKFGLYPDRDTDPPSNDVRRQFRSDIAVTLKAAEAAADRVNAGGSDVLLRDQGTLRVSFRYPDRDTANAVAAELGRLVIEENLHQPPVARYRLTGLPNQVSAGPNALAATGLGLGAGLLGGLGLATVRRLVRRRAMGH